MSKIQNPFFEEAERANVGQNIQQSLATEMKNLITKTIKQAKNHNPQSGQNVNQNTGNEVVNAVATAFSNAGAPQSAQAIRNAQSQMSGTLNTYNQGQLFEKQNSPFQDFMKNRPQETENKIQEISDYLRGTGSTDYSTTQFAFEKAAFLTGIDGGNLAKIYKRLETETNTLRADPNRGAADFIKSPYLARLAYVTKGKKYLHAFLGKTSGLGGIAGNAVAGVTGIAYPENTPEKTLRTIDGSLSIAKAAFDTYDEVTTALIKHTGAIPLDVQKAINPKAYMEALEAGTSVSKGVKMGARFMGIAGGAISVGLGVTSLIKNAMAADSAIKSGNTTRGVVLGVQAGLDGIGIVLDVVSMVADLFPPIGTLVSFMADVTNTVLSVFNELLGWFVPDPNARENFDTLINSSQFQSQIDALGNNFKVQGFDTLEYMANAYDLRAGVENPYHDNLRNIHTTISRQLTQRAAADPNSRNLRMAILGDINPNVIHGRAASDYLRGGGGADILYGGDGDDYLFGGPGGDTIYGGNGDDTLLGGKDQGGGNELSGGPGLDRLIAAEGAAQNRLKGGTGSDTYEIPAKCGHTMIDEVPESKKGGSFDMVIFKEGVSLRNTLFVSNEKAVDGKMLMIFNNFFTTPSAEYSQDCLQNGYKTDFPNTVRIDHFFAYFGSYQQGSQEYDYDTFGHIECFKFSSPRGPVYVPADMITSIALRTRAEMNKYGYNNGNAQIPYSNLLSLALDFEQEVYDFNFNTPRRKRPTPGEQLTQIEQQIVQMFINNYAGALQSYDANRDQMIDQNEMLNILLTAGIDQYTAQQSVNVLYATLDKDKNGVISIHDIQGANTTTQGTGTAQTQLSNIEQQIVQLFINNYAGALHSYDSNRDQMIDQNEMLNILLTAGIDQYTAQKSVNVLYATLDKDKNGVISIHDIQGANTTNQGTGTAQTQLSNIEQQIVQLFINNYAGALQSYDSNRDQMIDQNEMLNILLTAGIDQYTAQKSVGVLYATLDKDKNGVISIHDIQGANTTTQGTGTAQTQLSNIEQQIVQMFINNYAGALQSYDANRDQMIDQNEMLNILLTAGIDQYTAQQSVNVLYATLDKDKNGVISIHDIQGANTTTQRTGTAQTQLSNIEQQIVQMFINNYAGALQSYDANRDQMIDQNEMFNILMTAGIDQYTAQQSVNVLYATLDKDKNGVISIQDIQGASTTTQGTGTAQTQLSNIEQQIVQMFINNYAGALQSYDANRDQMIDQNEMFNILMTAGIDQYTAQQSVNVLYAVLDKDKNGVISIQDIQI